MSYRNNNLSPIPFYESLDEQDFRKWYSYGYKYPHRVSGDNLIPFFLTYGDPIASVTEIKFYKACCSEDEITGGGSYSLAFDYCFSVTGTPNNQTFGETLLSYCGVYNADDDSYGVIYYTAPDISIGIPQGIYYMEITFELEDGDSVTRYSDVFFVDDSSSIDRNCIELKWYDGEDLEFSDGVIPYSQTMGSRYYGNKIYIETEIGMPEYSFTEDGEERDGRFFPIKQLSEKVYKFKFLAPEYLCDAMRLIRLSDVVTITDRYGREYEVEHFEMDVDWLEGGVLANVECTFETDTIVKKIAKDYDTITSR